MIGNVHARGAGTRLASILLAVANLCTVTGASSQTAPTPLDAFAKSVPGTLINDPTRLDWQVYGPGVAVKSIREPSIPGGQAANQITIPKRGANPYETSANVPLTTTVAVGEKVVMSFFARTISAETDDGQAVVTVRFQQNAAPYSGFGDTTLRLGKDWKLYEVPTTATTALAKGIGVGVFQLSGAKQVIQIGQTVILKGASSILVKPASGKGAAALPIMPPQLSDKGALLNDPAARTWSTHGFAAPPEPITAGIPGGVATQFTVGAKSTNVWEASAGVPIGDAVAPGDPLIVAFIARTIAADTPDGKAIIGVRVQQNVAPYDGFADHAIAVGANWGFFQLKTTAKMALPKGGGEVTLQLAGAKQIVEIGPVYVIRAVRPLP